MRPTRLKIGTPLNLIYRTLATLFIPEFWPFVGAGGDHMSGGRGSDGARPWA